MSQTISEPEPEQLSGKALVDKCVSPPSGSQRLMCQAVALVGRFRCLRQIDLLSPGVMVAGQSGCLAHAINQDSRAATACDCSPDGAS